MTEIEAINAILSVIQSGGLVAALIIAIRLGLTGEVVPKSVVTAIVRETVAATISELVDQGVLKKYPPHVGLSSAPETHI